MRTPPGPCLLTLALVLGVAGPSAAQGVADLGTLPTHSGSRARDITDQGTIVGQAHSDAGLPQQAVRWVRQGSAGFTVEELPTLAGLLDSDAMSVSNSGAAVGWSALFDDAFTLLRAVLWKRDASQQWVPIDLEPPPGHTDGLALAINARDEVAGETWNAVEGVRHAVVWLPQPDKSYLPCDLGVPDGYETTVATDINGRGDVVGTARRREIGEDDQELLRSDVVVWREAQLAGGECIASAALLPSHPDLPTNLRPALNDSGVVVARADRAGAAASVSRALRWEPSGAAYGAPVELPLPRGVTDAIAVDVNARGHVLGTAFVREDGALTASRAVMWLLRRGRWVIRSLETPPGTAFATASRFNDRGDAVGAAPLPPEGASGGLLWARGVRPSRTPILRRPATPRRRR